MQAPINALPVVKKQKFIDVLEISNFKFFPAIGEDNKPIKINGKHLLVYGENGSGKSSFYWALYTLLECANKPNDEQIEKYFKYNGVESLLNINATQQAEPNNNKAENAYVKIRLKDDANADYIISYDDVDIRTKLEPQISNFASDFINYRVLYSAFNYAHSEEVDLYHHFKYTVFPYVKFDDPCTIWIENADTGIWEEKVIQDANPIIHFLENGAFYEELANEKKKYNLTIQQVKDVKKSLGSIKSTLQKLLTHINTKGNEVLKELGYDNIDFYVQLVEKENALVKTKSYKAPDYKIYLKNRNYNGQVGRVHRIHSFFNEAKSTAVSLAIRFAILEKKPDDAQIKILVLDDLMVSLDMNNRTKVIDYIFKTYLSRYQIFILTHDKNLYDFIAYKIKQWDNVSNWVFKEMYAGNNEETKKDYPIVIDGELELIDKAQKYYDAKDYTACSIYIRKEFEKIINQRLPPVLKEKVDGNFLSLQTLWKNMVNRYESLSKPIKQDLIKIFEETKLLVLNPQAHFQDVSLPLYKIELDKAFTLIKELKANYPIPEYTILLSKGMKLQFKHPVENYTFDFELLSDFSIDCMSGTRVSNLPKCKVNHWQYNGTDFYIPALSSVVSADRIAKILKKNDDKLDDILLNLKRDNVLSITNQLFIDNTTIENCIWSFKEIIEKAGIIL